MSSKAAATAIKSVLLFILFLRRHGECARPNYITSHSCVCQTALWFSSAGCSRLGELTRVDRNFDLHLAQFSCGPPVQPRYGPTKRHLHSSHLAIIRVVNLRGI